MEAFKIVQLPREIELINGSGRVNTLYIQIIKSLEVMDITKAIELAPSELGKTTIGNFKSYLRQRCEAFKCKFIPIAQGGWHRSL